MFSTCCFSKKSTVKNKTKWLPVDQVKLNQSPSDSHKSSSLHAPEHCPSPHFNYSKEKVLINVPIKSVGSNRFDIKQYTKSINHSHKVNVTKTSFGKFANPKYMLSPDPYEVPLPSRWTSCVKCAY
jgi:hypothetical protein